MKAGRTITTGFVLERCETSAQDKLVLCAIIHRREQNDRQEWTKLPFDQMAELTSLSERTCQRRVEKLHDWKILERKTDKGRTANRYKIIAEAIPLRPKKQHAKGPQLDSGSKNAETLNKDIA
jgi:uncharacterized protein involved in type VI secretion and phage assembly